MKNHNCSEIKELLSSFIDKEVSQEEERLINEHLETCSDCAKELSELMELKYLMEKIGKEELEAPEGFAESVMNKIENEKIQQEKEGRLYGLFDSFFKKPWIPAVIAAMLLVVIYIPDSLGPMMARDGGAEKESLENQLTVTFTSDDAKMKEGLTRASGVMDAPAPQIAPDFAPITGSGEFKDNILPEERKIIRNGYISGEVRDYQKAEEGISAKTRELGGYISNSNSWYFGEKQDMLAGNMTLRIPEHNFDQMMSFIETMGKINNKSTSSNDVTEEFFDVNTRINSLRVKEDRLLEILSKQGDLKDLLAVENELAQTRTEIERLEGRINFLSGQVAYSSIDINLMEVRDLEGSISGDSVKGIGTRIKEAVIKSINQIIDFGVKAVVLISSALPFLLILLVVYLVLRVIWNKKNRDL